MTCALCYIGVMVGLAGGVLAAAITSGAETVARAIEKRSKETTP